MSVIPYNELAALLETRINQIIQEQNLGSKKNFKAGQKASAKLAKKMLENLEKAEHKAVTKGTGKGKKEQKPKKEKTAGALQPKATEPPVQK